MFFYDVIPSVGVSGRRRGCLFLSLFVFFNAFLRFCVVAAADSATRRQRAERVVTVAEPLAVTDRSPTAAFEFDEVLSNLEKRCFFFILLPFWYHRKSDIERQ